MFKCCFCFQQKDDDKLSNKSKELSHSNISTSISTETLNIFNNQNIASIPYFSLEGLKTWCRVIDIYDGDTITVVIPLLTTMYKFHIRLYGLDTPEIKSSNEENKQKAILARNRLIELCTDIPTNVATNLKTRKEIQKFFDETIYLVWISCYNMDKYGRVLANIYKTSDSDKAFSQILIQEKLGYEYFGKTKNTT
jgi:endonuclease YncB( thermonuclease family)